ncbi:MAG: hypothetical protein JWQ74_2962 [Marmoricola sp.]|nr:hypothetical protein [Marmoricola sp.]
MLIAEATTGTRLGGNLPAVLVSPQGRVARALEMTPSGFSMVAMFDFHRLRPGDQARLRALIARTAPTALVSLASDTDTLSQDRSTGLLVALAGATGASGVALAGLLSSGIALRDVRRSLRDLGVARSVRRRMTVVTILVELLPVAGVAWFLRAHWRPSGLAWMVPFAGQLLLVLITCLYFYPRPAKPGRFRADPR